MEATYVSVNRLMDKENVICITFYIHHIIYVYNKHMCIHTHTIEYYLVLKKEEILPLMTTWMNLEEILLSKISQTQKYKYCMISLICGI